MSEKQDTPLNTLRNEKQLLRWERRKEFFSTESNKFAVGFIAESMPKQIITMLTPEGSSFASVFQSWVPCLSNPADPSACVLTVSLFPVFK